MASKASISDIVLTAEQVRAARALMGWSRKELPLSRVFRQGTLKAIETGRTDYRLSTLRKLMHAFEAHGVAFHKEDGWSGIVIRVAKLEQLTRVA